MASKTSWPPPARGFPPVPITPPPSTRPNRRSGRGTRASQVGVGDLAEGRRKGPHAVPSARCNPAAHMAEDAVQHSRPPLAAKPTPSPPPGAAAPASKSPHLGHYLQHLRAARGRIHTVIRERPAATKGRAGRWVPAWGETQRRTKRPPSSILRHGELDAAASLLATALRCQGPRPGA
jgi:hypothetical protein